MARYKAERDITIWNMNLACYFIFMIRYKEVQYSIIQTINKIIKAYGNIEKSNLLFALHIYANENNIVSLVATKSNGETAELTS